MTDLGRFTYEELLEQFYGKGDMKVENPLTVREMLCVGDTPPPRSEPDFSDLNAILHELTEVIVGLNKTMEDLRLEQRTARHCPACAKTNNHEG